MKCKNCGWENAEGQVKCLKCKMTLGDFDPLATTTSCVECGYPIRPGGAECPSCGYTVSVMPVDNQVQENQTMPATTASIMHDDGVPDNEKGRLTGMLISFSRDPKGAFYPLYEGENSIGRAASTDICIQSDRAISEKHLTIHCSAVDRRFRFIDENSSNGVCINGRPLGEGELRHMDKIHIGATILHFMELPHHVME